jgi:hypothetical protein
MSGTELAVGARVVHVPRELLADDPDYGRFIFRR